MLLAIVTRWLQLHLHRRIHHNGIRHEHLCWQWRGSFQLSIHAILVDFSAAMAPFAFELSKLSSDSSINSMAQFSEMINLGVLFVL